MYKRRQNWALSSGQTSVCASDVWCINSSFVGESWSKTPLIWSVSCVAAYIAQVGVQRRFHVLHCRTWRVICKRSKCLWTSPTIVEQQLLVERHAGISWGQVSEGGPITWLQGGGRGAGWVICRLSQHFLVGKVKFEAKELLSPKVKVAY